MAMPRPNRNKILKKVLSHLHKDIKEQKSGAREDEELIGKVKSKKVMHSSKKK